MAKRIISDGRTLSVATPDDLALPYWAGVVPLTLAAGAPLPADDLVGAPPPPDYLARRPVR